MAEDDIGVADQNTAGVASVRTILVTTVIDGTPTQVQMQVVSIADESGNIIRDFASYNMQEQMIVELRAIRRLLAQRNGMFDPITEQTGNTV